MTITNQKKIRVMNPYCRLLMQIVQPKLDDDLERERFAECVDSLAHDDMEQVAKMMLKAMAR